MEVDSAIAQALGLDASDTRVIAHGGSGFSSTVKITTIEDGKEKQFFGKIGKGVEKATMFEGEFTSLNAIHSVVPTLCPAALSHGQLESPGSYFLITEFLDMSSRPSSAPSSGQSLAQKLAKLHTTPAPIPEGYEKPVFGFPVTTCCGETPQENKFTESWGEFYVNHRLLSIQARCQKNNGKDDDLKRLVERTANEVVPKLIGDDHLNGGKGVRPVVVHGDLWSGNRGKAIIAGQGGVEDVIFDPSSCYAHNEFELGIMKMFGGFGSSFLNEYHNLCPKTEPVEEYEDRVSLYELYVLSPFLSIWQRLIHSDIII
jgi:protein-ribulosamine 3-kinase